MLRLAATGLRVSQRGAALQMSRRCLVTKFSKVRSWLQAIRLLSCAARAHSLSGAASARAQARIET